MGGPQYLEEEGAPKGIQIRQSVSPDAGGQSGGDRGDLRKRYTNESFQELKRSESRLKAPHVERR